MNDRSVDKYDLSLALLLLFTGSATIVDMVSDGFQEESVFHMIVEGSIFFASSAAFILLFIRMRKDSAIITSTSNQLSQKREDADRWKQRADVFLKGLGEEIQIQFDQWALTPSEKDVALYLIKGFSHKEIAQITHRSERTIRQHAGEVYVKSNLNGRAELAAFFLEDLLTPHS